MIEKWIDFGLIYKKWFCFKIKKYVIFQLHTFFLRLIKFNLY
jgi:hypothetical protein